MLRASPPIITSAPNNDKRPRLQASGSCSSARFERSRRHKRTRGRVSTHLLSFQFSATVDVHGPEAALLAGLICVAGSFKRLSSSAVSQRLSTEDHFDHGLGRWPLCTTAPGL